MVKKVERMMGREKPGSSVTNQSNDDDPNKMPEPYHCTGHFQTDFAELCSRENMECIPSVVIRPRRPPSPSAQPAVEEKTKAGRKADDKKNLPPPPEPEPEPLLDENGEPVEPPPKTYTTKDKFEYFKPCVQVEMDNPDKLDTVTEVFIRGWKVDNPMMTIFKQCWTKMDRLHTISLWNTGLTDETLELFASVLPEVNNLKSLVVENNYVPNEAYHLFLKDESPVQHLSLRYNGITDKGAELLGRALGTPAHQNQKLISLSLNGNRITDKGAEHLANGLRMNRTLLTLGLCANQIGDNGAMKIAEALHSFTLTHEEVVERRKLLLEKGASDRQKSPTPGGRRADSRDRPASVRSSQAVAKGKSAKSKGKDGKGKEEEKHDKSKGKKESEKTVKKDTRGPRASVAETTGKSVKKGDKGKKKTQQVEQEPTETPEIVTALLDTVEHLDGGRLLLTGNRCLLSLNLARNHIGEEGIRTLLYTVEHQSNLAKLHFTKSAAGSGLMRLNLNKNKMLRDSENLQRLNNIMLTKDPFYKPPATPEQDT